MSDVSATEYSTEQPVPRQLTREQVEVRVRNLDEAEASVLLDHDAALRHALAQQAQELERFTTMSTVEVMCVNANVDAHVREWEARCVKAEVALAAMTTERDYYKADYNRCEEVIASLEQDLSAMTSERDEAALRRSETVAMVEQLQTEFSASQARCQKLEDRDRERASLLKALSECRDDPHHAVGLADRIIGEKLIVIAQIQATLAAREARILELERAMTGEPRAETPPEG